MNFQFDTNIVIPVEPTSPDDVEPTTQSATQLVEKIGRHGHTIYLHPVSLNELDTDRKDERREMRSLLVRKYTELRKPPPPPTWMRAELPEPHPGTNDWRDYQLLAALAADAVHYFVTNDTGLRKKAAKLGLDSQTGSVDEALAYLHELHPEAPEPPPSVHAAKAHELDPSDPIFDSLRSDYPDFDGWFAKTRREQRDCWYIKQDGRYAAVCLVKHEPDGNDLDLSGAVIKISTFKVSDRFSGNRYGELLLKSVFEYLHTHKADHTYLSVFQKHEDLIAFLDDFGFQLVDDKRSPIGERYLRKVLRASATAAETTDPLPYHVKHGPPALHPEPPAYYIIPIEPRFHARLFPEAQDQPAFPEMSASTYGNAIRKAYLCHANIRQLERGSVALFYRSQDRQHLDVVGVVEQTRRSSDPATVAGFVGNRTVYTHEQIQEMSQGRDVLAILFRQDRTLNQPISLKELRSHNVIKGPPQTVQQIQKEGVEWLRQQIGR